MIFKVKKHNPDLYNKLLNLSRNIFFYKKIELKDSYETRIYLMFLHYSIVLFIQKKNNNLPDQENYNNLFFYIENNLRELGFGDVAVNKKMKDLNKIFYDILIKLSKKKINFMINEDLITKYFKNLENNVEKRQKLIQYINDFYGFCFELSSKSIINNLQNYKY
tara:strand:- start:504 stop:995 length:492 start_codon:yes stop_codon:yes gene_type:complete